MTKATPPHSSNHRVLASVHKEPELIFYQADQQSAPWSPTTTSRATLLSD